MNYDVICGCPHEPKAVGKTIENKGFSVLAKVCKSCRNDSTFEGFSEVPLD